MAEAEYYYNEAIRICRDEIEGNRATADSYVILAWTLQRKDQYRNVIEWGELGLRLYRNEYRLVEIMGEAYFYLNEYSRSLVNMQLYVDSLPQGERVPTAYFFMGEIYLLQRKYRRADIAYTAATWLEPSNSLWWYRCGLARERSGDTETAAEAFERSLRIYPGYSEARAGLERVRTTR
ncbi:hypothetical protein FACS1894164_07670 [Spirochaetia bacterium]|nr:hypothetical protein FACS1894164_07670 [Spirochaetia bacterium]